MKRRGKWAALFLLTVLIGGGLTVFCCTGQKEKTHRAAVDAVAEVILPMAEDGAVYFQALEAARACVSGEERLEVVLELLDSAEETLCLNRDSLEEEPLSGRLEGTLKKCGISPEEFQEFSGAHKAELEEFIWSLQSLETEFREKGAEFDAGEREAWITVLDVLEGAYWGYLYYEGINRWFAGWDEEQAAYARGRIADRLPADAGSRYPWETKLSVVEKKAAIFQKYREMYCEIPPEYSEETREEAAALRAEYENRDDSIFSAGSWLYSLQLIKNIREASEQVRRILEKRDAYSDTFAGGDTR